MKIKNVVAQSEFFFLFPMSTFLSVCTGQGDIWTTDVSDVKHIYRILCMHIIYKKEIVGVVKRQ